ncbi:hypothetical protein C8A05DRAFT_16692 [Staphylotrichum tortipilum]|uniref:DUF7136 domain-containing protein n=1 Tax=Staphylotrichum tortipilum TaxID=2831512 RepID=A0AAN6MIY4_9PEZI|nr:hypothetical protein C8A05DRAFT_16692 [Staphylotrichum longicolle]
MRLSSQAVWSLAASLAWLGAPVNAATHAIMEADLIFPRSGQFYTPTPYMPVVFALRNPKLAQYTDPYIEYEVHNLSSTGWKTYTQTLDGANRTNDEPYFVYTLLDTFAQPGNWKISFHLWWNSCKLNPAGEFYGYKSDHRCDCLGPSIEFHTREDGKAIELTAPVVENVPCIGEAIIVNDNTPRLLNETFPWQEGKISNRCVVASLVASEDFNWTRPCAINLDSTTAAAIMADVANMTSTTCAGPNLPSNCPSKSAAHRLAALAGPACVAAAVGLFQLLA